MIKRILCALCAVVMTLSLSACAGENTDELNMYELEKSMLAADDSLPEMKATGSWEDNAQNAFAYLSDLDYSKVQGYFLAYAADGMAYELAVVQLKDKADAAALEESLNEHVQTRVQMYKTYEPEQVQRAESAVIKTEGDCVLLIMSDAAQKAESAFKEFTK